MLANRSNIPIYMGNKDLAQYLGLFLVEFVHNIIGSPIAESEKN